MVGAFEGSKKVGAFEPKTIKDSMEEFFSLFTEEQREQLKDESEYSAFLEIVKDKDRLPMDKLNTESELKQVEKIIS